MSEKIVVGIDVSKANSEVAILINGQNIHGYYSMPNGTIGFNHLLKDLKTEQHNRYYIPSYGCLFSPSSSISR